MSESDTHVVDELGDYLDGELSGPESRRVSEHLVRCRDCRQLHDVLRDGLDEIRALPAYDAPLDVWSGIERTLDTRRGGTERVEAAGIATSPWWWRRAAVVLVVVGLGALASATLFGAFNQSWSVERLAGSPLAGTRQVAGKGHLAEGEWLETDAGSRARLSIGSLGSADVGPGSRLRLVRAGGSERALRVDRGTIDARVWAPPRFFIVETAAATAIDLGCIYSLSVDEQGVGVLLVKSGQVELTGAGRTSLVVAGTAAEMRPDAGPGTPYSSAASERFRVALAVLDFGGGYRATALERVLTEADVRSTITLWHLLPRVSVAERADVYDRLAALAAPPRGVGVRSVLDLDPRALSKWRSTLEPHWSSERVRLWKRAWRAVWSMARGQ